MLDHRIYTFIELCKLMNYRKTAEQLNMTQPAITQHIKYLEKEYHCKLFLYDGKSLSRTPQCEALLNYAKTVVYNDQMMKQQLLEEEMKILRIGATKTIGDYILRKEILYLAKQKNLALTCIIENTNSLLKRLNNLELDFAIIEGYFDKSRYGYQLYKKENFIGICNINHKFANKIIDLEDILKENIVVREDGSGTRDILSNILYENNYSIHNFKKCTTISSFEVIKDIIKDTDNISFVYEAIAKSDSTIAPFEIKNYKIEKELSFVYLKDTYGEKMVNGLLASTI